MMHDKVRDFIIVTGGLGAWTLLALLVLAVTIGPFYVAAHFIAKFW